MAILLPGMGFQALDENGEIIPSGNVRVKNYSDGTPAVTYQDSAATIQNPYIIPLSESGYADIYLAGGTYEILLSDSDDTLIRTISKFTPFEGNNGGTNYGNKEEFIATASQANYTSSDIPIGTVSVHVNGLMLDTTLYSVSGNVITFSPVLNAGDQVIYEYSSEAIGGASSGAGNIWASTTNYGVGIIVSYNGEVYVCTSSNLNKRPDLEPTYWAISKGSALWNVTKNYGIGDIISYGSFVYVSLALNIGKQPDTETTYWKNITLGMVWGSGKNYLIGDVVTEGTLIYIALTDNINKQPSTNDTDWEQIDKRSVVQIADATPGDTTTHTFDYDDGDMQQITCPAAGTLTLAFDNFPTGRVAGFIVDLVNGGDCEMAYPAGMFFANKTEPILTEAGTDRVLVMSDKDAVLTLTVVAYDIGTV